MRKNSQLEKTKNSQLAKKQNFQAGGEKMYLEVRDLKKNYGENGSYVQVLKGNNTEVEK